MHQNDALSEHAISVSLRTKEGWSDGRTQSAFRDATRTWRLSGPEDFPCPLRGHARARQGGAHRRSRSYAVSPQAPAWHGSRGNTRLAESLQSRYSWHASRG